MAKRSAPSAPPSDKPALSSDKPALFGFVGIVVTKILFTELAKVPLAPGDKVIPRLQSNVSLGFGIKEPEFDKAEVRFGLSVTGDPRDKPYQIEVEIAGQFTLKEGTRDDFEAFCKQRAPVILFPYIRELVNRLTQDARFGPIRLDPLNVADLIKPEGWKTAEPPVRPPTSHANRET